MVKWTVTFLLAAAAIAGAQAPAPKYPGCAADEFAKSDYALKSRHDEFRDITTYESSDMPLDPSKDESRFELKAATYGANQKTTYFFLVSYIGKSWVFIDPDSPMLLLVDGKKMSLPPEGKPTRDVWEGGEVYESLIYDVSDSTLSAMAKATAVKIRINGEKYIPDFTISKEGECGLARFVNERIVGAK